MFFLVPEIVQVSPGAISLLNCTGNLEKMEKIQNSTKIQIAVTCRGQTRPGIEKWAEYCFERLS